MNAVPLFNVNVLENDTWRPVVSGRTKQDAEIVAASLRKLGKNIDGVRVVRHGMLGDVPVADVNAALAARGSAPVRREHLAGRYAAKYVNDTDREPTDAAIVETLAGCSRPPKPEELASIRAAVLAWREENAMVMREP